jgi:transcriptional regulator with XRE-family HTH domain
MQVATKKEVKEQYPSGFSKKMVRNKYDLPLNVRLKGARNRKGLSSASVVKELKKQGINIGHSTLQGYEADENSLNHRYPSLNALIALASFYDVSFDYLFGLSDKFTPHQLPDNLDIKDILDGNHPIVYNGIKLTRKQRESVTEYMDELTAF